MHDGTVLDKIDEGKLAPLLNHMKKYVYNGDEAVYEYN